MPPNFAKYAVISRNYGVSLSQSLGYSRKSACNAGLRGVLTLARGAARPYLDTMSITPKLKKPPNPHEIRLERLFRISKICIEKLFWWVFVPVSSEVASDVEKGHEA